MDDRLKKLPCDICGKSATRWFMSTSATVCEKPTCYAVHQERWDDAQKEYEEE